jgi:ATP-dependent Clp protease adaptor protein ClpS
MSKSSLDLQHQDRVEYKKPSLYNVVILNDDYTLIEFVVVVLVEVFHKSLDDASSLALKVHQQGFAVAGVFTKEIAETKIYLVEGAAQKAGHPLRAVLEPADS